MDTLPQFRQHGFARSVLTQMHVDGLDGGLDQSVLFSSPSGLGLYQSMGYTILATMQAFVPKG